MKSRTNSDGLPRYLVFDPRAKNYYYYRKRQMDKRANFGKDPKHAISYANRLNLMFDEREMIGESTRIVESVRLPGSRTFHGQLDYFGDYWIDERRLKQSTAAGLRQRIERLKRKTADVALELVTTEFLSKALRNEGPFEYAKVRIMLVQFIRWAKSEGYYSSVMPNPASELLTRMLPKKQRTRMTMEQYWAIYDRAEQCVQWAMTLILHLGIRREDAGKLVFGEHVNDAGLIMDVSKSISAHRDLVTLGFGKLHPDVRMVIEQSRETAPMSCMHIIKRKPLSRQPRKDGRHWAIVGPDYLTKLMKQARDRAIAETNLFDGLGPKQMPGLHEIRSLSSYLYTKSGYEVEEVQNLLGHSKLEMTMRYIAGHEAPVTEVRMLLDDNLLERNQ